MTWAEKKLKKKGVVLGTDEEAVVDAGAGKKFRQVTVGRCPTIARSRGSSRNSYLLKRKRFLGFQSHLSFLFQSH